MRTQIDVHDYERIILLEGESARACALDILFYSILEKAVQEKENECSILAEQICTHECKITKRARERENPTKRDHLSLSSLPSISSSLSSLSLRSSLVT